MKYHAAITIPTVANVFFLFFFFPVPSFGFFPAKKLRSTNKSAAATPETASFMISFVPIFTISFFCYRNNGIDQSRNEYSDTESDKCPYYAFVPVKPYE